MHKKRPGSPWNLNGSIVAEYFVPHAAAAMGVFSLEAKASLDPKHNGHNACFVSALKQRSKGKQATNS